MARLRSRNGLLETLTAPEHPDASTPCEFLLFAGPLAKAADQLQSLPVPRQAACMVVLGSVITDAGPATRAAVAELMCLTAAAGPGRASTFPIGINA